MVIKKIASIGMRGRFYLESKFMTAVSSGIAFKKQ